MAGIPCGAAVRAGDALSLVEGVGELGVEVTCEQGEGGLWGDLELCIDFLSYE